MSWRGPSPSLRRFGMTRREGPGAASLTSDNLRQAERPPYNLAPRAGRQGAPLPYKEGMHRTTSRPRSIPRRVAAVCDRRAAWGSRSDAATGAIGVASFSAVTNLRYSKSVAGNSDPPQNELPTSAIPLLSLLAIGFRSCGAISPRPCGLKRPASSKLLYGLAEKTT